MAKSSLAERIKRAQKYLNKLHREIPQSIGKKILQNYPRLSDGKRLESYGQFKQDYKIVRTKAGEARYDKHFDINKSNYDKDYKNDKNNKDKSQSHYKNQIFS